MPDIVLGPLTGRSDAEWYQAPPGKWSSAQIVQHLTLLIEYSTRTFESRRGREPMRRRPRSAIELIGYLLVMRVGWIPRGWRAPKPMRPAEQSERTSVERCLALERDLLPVRRADLFVKHPVLGDLTIPEWGRFHLLHCQHHLKQIRERLAA